MNEIEIVKYYDKYKQRIILNQFVSTLENVDNYQYPFVISSKNEFKIYISNDIDFASAIIDDFHLVTNTRLKDDSRKQRIELYALIEFFIKRPTFWELPSRGQTYYLFTNALASWSNYNPFYFISESAMLVLEAHNISIDNPLTRHELFNIRLDDRQKLLTFEHVVPVTFQLKLMQKKVKELGSDFDLKKFLHTYGIVCVITKTEDRRLRSHGLNNKMSSGKKDEIITSIWQRYKTANIQLSKALLPVYGKMYR